MYSSLLYKKAIRLPCIFGLSRTLSHYCLSQGSDYCSLPNSGTSLFFLPLFSVLLSNLRFLPCFRLLASCPACLMATVSSDPTLPLQILEYYLNLEFLIFAMYVSWKIKLSDYQLKGKFFSKCLFLVTIIEIFLCNRILTSWGMGMAVILIFFFFMMLLFSAAFKANLFLCIYSWNELQCFIRMKIWKRWDFTESDRCIVAFQHRVVPLSLRVSVPLTL